MANANKRGVDLDDQATWICDFCDRRGGVHWTHVTPNTAATAEEANAKGDTWHEDPNWAACDTCHYLVMKGDQVELGVRSFRNQWDRQLVIADPEFVEQMRNSMLDLVAATHAAFWRSYHGEYYWDSPQSREES